MINLFLHHLNACKIKLRLQLRGTKEKSFEINKSDSLDNWIFIVVWHCVPLQEIQDMPTK